MKLRPCNIASMTMIDVPLYYYITQDFSIKIHLLTYILRVNVQYKDVGWNHCPMPSLLNFWFCLLD